MIIPHNIVNLLKTSFSLFPSFPFECLTSKVQIFAIFEFGNNCCKSFHLYQVIVFLSLYGQIRAKSCRGPNQIIRFQHSLVFIRLNRDETLVFVRLNLPTVETIPFQHRFDRNILPSIDTLFLVEEAFREVPKLFP